MSEGFRRGVTRGYVGGLVAATVIATVAATVAVWGLLALWMGRDPISEQDFPRWLGPASIVFALGLLSFILWRQALTLLYGRRQPHWGWVSFAAIQGYLVWSLLGMLAGLPDSDTWVSPFAWALVPVWGVAALLFWAVLARRVYTRRGTPQWPWEKDDDLGPDWSNYGLDPWQSDDSPAGSEPRDVPGDPSGVADDDAEDSDDDRRG
ncbi:MAG: hypothetical protein ACTHZ9_10080 [Leucobacter sp.]